VVAVATDLIEWSEVQPHLHDIMTLLKPSEGVRKMMQAFHTRISHGRYTHTLSLPPPPSLSLSLSLARTRTHTHIHTQRYLAGHWRRGDRACDTVYNDVTVCDDVAHTGILPRTGAAGTAHTLRCGERMAPSIFFCFLFCVVLHSHKYFL
jgi:hypothetical protein